MDNLFDHPGFRLIYVDDDGNMSLITPLEHKEDIENGYRCISHLWETQLSKLPNVTRTLEEFQNPSHHSDF